LFAERSSNPTARACSHVKLSTYSAGIPDDELELLDDDDVLEVLELLVDDEELEVLDVDDQPEEPLLLLELVVEFELELEVGVLSRTENS